MKVEKLMRTYKIISVIILFCLLLTFIIFNIQLNNATKQVEEFNSKDNNIYCLASIECENNCNAYNKGDTFLKCRYECMTLKNCD